MKTKFESAIRQITLNRKLFFINLFNGNEKCIHGELYAELNKDAEFHVALEYPIGNREHADIAFFQDDSFKQLDFVIELKHYSPHQTDPEESAVREIKKELIKRLENGVKVLYVIQVLTHIRNVSNQMSLTKYPFTKTYAKSMQNINNASNKLDEVYAKLKKGIDSDVKYVYSDYNIDNEIDVRLHFYICGPFNSDCLDEDDKFDESRLPISST